MLILNTFGILQNYFKYAKSVFIGKSLIKKLENDGGQNPIDAAKLGCKIYMDLMSTILEKSMIF